MWVGQMGYSPLLVFHVLTGGVGLLSGAAALAVRKGSARHTLVGTVFAFSMMATALSGIVVSVVRSLPGNISVGVVTFYLVATGWYTARRGNPHPNWLDKSALVLTVLVGVANLSFGILAMRSVTGKFIGYPPGPLFMIATVALIAGFGDLRMIRRGGVKGTARVVRHLWRMCFGLFVAAASIFTRTHLFPVWMRTSGTLSMLILLPLAMMFFWLVRIRKVPVGPAAIAR